MTYCTFSDKDDAGFAKLLDIFIKGKGNKRLNLLKKFTDIKKDLDPEDPTDAVLLEKRHPRTYCSLMATSIQLFY